MPVLSDAAAKEKTMKPSQAPFPATRFRRTRQSAQIRALAYEIAYRDQA